MDEAHQSTGIAPDAVAVGELAFVAQRVGKQDAVDPAGRRSGDRVDHHVGAGEILELRPGGRIYIGVYGAGGLYNEVVTPAATPAGKVIPRPVTARVLRRWLQLTQNPLS